MDKRYAQFRFLRGGIKGFMEKLPKAQRMVAEMRADWAKIVGDGIAAHSSPSEVKQGTLNINVDDPIWISELTLMRDDIFSNISDYVNDAYTMRYFKRLRFRNGALPKADKKEKAPHMKIPPEKLKEINEKVKTIDDKNLRDAMRHYLIQASLVPDDSPTDDNHY